MQDNELLEKYNEICDNVSNIIKKGFDSEPVFNDKCFINIIFFIMIKCQKKVLNVFVCQFY